MRIIKISLYFLFIIFLVFCSSSKKIISQKITKDGLEILYGEISTEQLFYDFPEWENIYKNFIVNKSILDSIPLVNKNLISVDIFLGTWCGDSKREVPRFLKIIDDLNLVSKNNLNIYAVDRKKKLKSGLGEQNNIQRVATFIIKNKSKEIGRIVEFPEKSLESDLLKILRNQ